MVFSLIFSATCMPFVVLRPRLIRFAEFIASSVGPADSSHPLPAQNVAPESPGQRRMQTQGEYWMQLNKQRLSFLHSGTFSFGSGSPP